MLVLNAVFSVEGAVYQRSSDVEDIWDLSDWMQVAAEKSLMAVWRFYIVNLFHEINEVMGNLESWSQESMASKSPHNPCICCTWTPGIFHGKLTSSSELTPRVRWNFGSKTCCKKDPKGCQPWEALLPSRMGRVMSHTFHTSVYWNNMKMLRSLTRTIDYCLPSPCWWCFWNRDP